IELPGSTNDREGEAIFYNAALDHDTDRNVLGFFCHGASGASFTSIEDDDALIRLLLSQLDSMFSGAATPAYRKHITQDWSREPFIKGTYSDFFGDPNAAHVLAQSLDDRVFFAGEAYAGHDWAYVHVAALSGRDRAREVVDLARR
ncbi:MAG: FAD-dependent oxidoreductase, partial [Planctomycetota bacterium]